MTDATGKTGAAPGKPARRPRNNAAITARKRAEGKDLGGRPRFEIDYETLQNLCAIHCTGAECAAVLGVSYETLNRRLAEDYAEAKADLPADEEPADRFDGFLEYSAHYQSKGRASLRRAQFKAATDTKNPNIRMQIWLGKQWLQQADRVDHSSTDGSMTPKQPEAMTREELDRELARRGIAPPAFLD